MKNDFSVYRIKKLIASQKSQQDAHELAQRDAKEQILKGNALQYTIKGTFGDGVNDTRMGTLKRGRMYWKFVK